MQRLLIRGQVQGVGFRPLVYRLAHELELQGHVRNTRAGVSIDLQGKQDALEQFEPLLRSRLPDIARIDHLERQLLPNKPQLSGFHILESDATQGGLGEVQPDMAPCPECLAELFDPANRRWRYPFINCTQCGPRYSILQRLPYDRSNTSMDRFDQCDACRQEYGMPDDRRFHAQPNACSTCGPSIWLERADGERVSGNPVAGALAEIERGGIVALRGVGGFHLVCDARNGAALARLRQRKRRPAKPFAIMAANVASLTGLVSVNQSHQRWLQDRSAPVVILPRSRFEASEMLPDIAPGLDALGVMLPQSPLHWLLYHEAAGQPTGTDWLTQPHPLLLVMTSANLSGEPLIHDNDTAREQLHTVADLWLLHDRDIVHPQDDAVVNALAEPIIPVRSGRGCSPLSVALPLAGPSILALGSYMKNSLCVTGHQRGWVSQPVGDLTSAESCRRLLQQAEQLPALYGVRPDLITVDCQPDSYSYRLAQQLGELNGLPVVEVQHHHAHVAAVMAEHQLADPVIGLALDGLGLGEAGELRGGELLRVDATGYQRLGSLLPLPLPGGDRAAREPWRLALALLWQLGHQVLLTRRYGHQPHSEVLVQMLESGFNCPFSSSVGRLFDAVSGLLGICEVQSYEAHAAMLLEAQVVRLPEACSDHWRQTAAGDLDVTPLLQQLVHTSSPREGAERFHATLIAALADWLGSAARKQGISTVVLSGGCLLNRWLRAGLVEQLQQQGLRPYLPHRLPPGDGALALGQAWVQILRAAHNQRGDE